MASTVSPIVVISCPQCGTRYQVAPETLGRKGRKVTCAECGGVWQARPESAEPEDADRMFGEEEEAALDAAFAAAEPPAPSPQAFAEPPGQPSERNGVTADEGGLMRSIADIKAAITPRQRPAPVATEQGERKRQKDFARRQAAQRKLSPLAKLRRWLRLLGVGTLLTLIICGVAFRTEVVRQFPDLAGAYEALGLGVNVVGLEFRDVRTLVALRGGANVLRVDARIFSVAARQNVVPPVAVTLLDENGGSLYQWSVVPDARELQPGEIVDFTTQLSSPPAGTSRVRLTFMDGTGRGSASTTTTMSK